MDLAFLCFGLLKIFISYSLFLSIEFNAKTNIIFKFSIK